MPFTVSHVAAVLPAYRVLSRAHLFTAAVVGSMVPDLGLLLPGAPGRLETHSLPGLFTFCVPVGLAVYWLTLTLIKPAILEIVPDGAYARLLAAHATAPRPSLRGWLYVALVILAGAAIHVLWDSFTHENAPGVRMFPVLDEFGPEIGGHSLQLYHWLQYGSSVVGLVAVTIAMLLWLAHAPQLPQQPRRRLGLAERLSWCGIYVLLPLLAVAAAFWYVRIKPRAPVPLGRVLEFVAIAGMRVSGVTLVIVSLLLRARLALFGQPARS
jgi:hypothetical protein